MSAWLFQVLRFTSAKARRSESRRRSHEAEAARQRQSEIASTESPWRELAPLLDEAVAHLNRRDRQAILLRYYEQRSLADVASVLVISEEGARKRVARAIAKLRVYFAKHGLAVNAAAVGATMEACTSHAAPAGLAINLGQASNGQSLFQSWLRQMRLRILLKLTGLAMVGLLVISGAAAWLWMTTRNTAPPIVTTLATDATTASEPPLRASDVTLAQIIVGVRRAEHAFSNIHIKNFDTTVDKLPKGKTEWNTTHLRYSGSAWYDSNPRGSVRIYYNDLVMPWQMNDHSPISWTEMIEDFSWNGSEGRELRVAGTTTNHKLTRSRVAMVEDKRSMLLDRFSLWATGVGFTTQYIVTDQDGISPPRPRVSLSQFLQRALDLGKRAVWDVSRQNVNGFDAIRVHFPGPGDNGVTYWFDPSRGFAIVKKLYVLDLRVIGRSYHRTEGFDVQQLKELKSGVWFPMQANVVMEDLSAGQGSYIRYNYQAADAIANDPKFNPDVFTAKIPTGWLVGETQNGVRRDYVTKEDGSQQEIHSGIPMPHVHAGVAVRPDGDTPAVASERNAGW